jgi:hypothetical protein
MHYEPYLKSLRNRMVADGCTVTDQALGPVNAVVGYRSDFLPQMMFSKLHLFTVATAVEEISAFAVEDFIKQVGTYGKDAKGAMRGMQSGVATFAVLVGDRVHPDAVAAAVQPAKIEFAVRTQPVVVDLSTGVVHTFRGRQLWGFAMNGYLRRKLNLYVPDPVQLQPDPPAPES